MSASYQFTKNHLLILFFATFLSSCASLSGDECMLADWNEIGFNDGAKGQAETYFKNHRKACAKHGVTSDFSAWMDGRKAGLLRYCTAQNGYKEGLNNRKYHGVCDGQAGFDFEQAYQHGNELYTQKQLVEDLDKELNNNIRDRERLDKKWTDLSQLLVNNNLSREERSDLVSQMERIKEDLSDMAAEHQFLAERYANESERLSRMEYRHLRDRNTGN